MSPSYLTLLPDLNPFFDWYCCHPHMPISQNRAISQYFSIPFTGAGDSGVKRCYKVYTKNLHSN